MDTKVLQRVLWNQRFSPWQGCTSWVSPVAFHHKNKNAVVLYNLTQDPAPLMDLSAEQIAEKLYTKTEDLNGEERIGLKLVHLNKCPVLAPAKTLLPENAERLGIDRQACLEHLAFIQKHPEIKAKFSEVFEFEKEFEPESNAEYRLYDGFLSESDKQQMQTIHQFPISQHWQIEPNFIDDRLKQLWRIYKARYFTSSLDPKELNWWQQYRSDKLMQGLDNPNLTAEEFQLSLERNLETQQDSDKAKAILKELYLYAQSL